MLNIENEIRRIVREELARMAKGLIESPADGQAAPSANHLPLSASVSLYSPSAIGQAQPQALPFPHRPVGSALPFFAPRGALLSNVSPPPAAVKASRRTRSSHPPKKARNCSKKLAKFKAAGQKRYLRELKHKPLWLAKGKRSA